MVSADLHCSFTTLYLTQAESLLETLKLQRGFLVFAVQ